MQLLFTSSVVLCFLHFSSAALSSSSIQAGTSNMIYEFITKFGVVDYESQSSLIRPECRRDLKILFDESKLLSPWALKMLDASGKPGHGILNGNIHMVGSTHQCVNIGFDAPLNHPANGKTALKADVHEKPPSRVKEATLTGKYCMATVYVEPTEELLANETVRLLFDRVFSYHAIRSSYEKDEHGFMLTTSSISQGLCLPGSCNYQDVHHLLEASYRKYNSSGLITRVRVDERYCFTKQDLERINWENSVYTLIPLAVFFTLAIIATKLDTNPASPRPKNQGTAKTFLLAFSLRRTVPLLLDTTLQPGEITCLHGIRFVALIIVYFQHKVFFRLFNMIVNRTDMILDGSNASSSPIRSLYTGTDIFVFLSAALTSFYATHKLAKTGRLNWKQMVLSRYLKFTPTLIAITWFTRYMKINLTSQYFRMAHFFRLSCQNNWRFFLNFFHVQNLFLGLGEICVPQSHSLATDMQHYLLAPFVVMLLWKLRKSKITLTIMSSGLILALTLYKGYTVYKNHLTNFGYFGLTVEERRRSLSILSISPLHQFTTYFLGLLFGVFMQRTKPIILSRVQKSLCWIIFFVCLRYATFRLSHASYQGYQYEVWENTEYAMVRPLAASVALAILIYLCHTGQAESLNRFLSWPYFVIFTKLSFGFYLFSVMYIVWFMNADYSLTFHIKLSVMVDLNEIASILITSILTTLLLMMPLKDIAPLILGATRSAETVKNLEVKAETNEASTKTIEVDVISTQITNEVPTEITSKTEGEEIAKKTI